MSYKSNKFGLYGSSLSFCDKNKLDNLNAFKKKFNKTNKNNKSRNEMSCLTKEQVSGLLIGEEIDYRNQNGELVRAVVVQKNTLQNKIRITFTGLPESYDVWCCVETEFSKFSRLRSVSRKHSLHFPDITKGDWLQLQVSTNLWVKAKVLEINEMTGKAQLMYEKDNKKVICWVDLDDQAKVMSTKSFFELNNNNKNPKSKFKKKNFFDIKIEDIKKAQKPLYKQKKLENWDHNDVVNWLQSSPNQLKKYIPYFKNKKINGLALDCLENTDYWMQTFKSFDMTQDHAQWFIELLEPFKNPTINQIPEKDKVPIPELNELDNILDSLSENESKVNLSIQEDSKESLTENELNYESEINYLSESESEPEPEPELEPELESESESELVGRMEKVFDFFNLYRDDINENQNNMDFEREYSTTEIINNEEDY